MVFDKPSAALFCYFLFLSTLKLCLSCPESCICKWKNGKQTVECINKDLLIIPEGMDSGTQVLEFSGNNLHSLHREKFLKLDLINLQRIYLAKCRISQIDDHTFKGLTNLVELDLSNNLLEIVPTEAFADCPSLMKLTLSNNPIKTIKKLAFSQLPELSTLELSHCDISKVESTAFDGLHNLEWLSLNGNKLTAIKGKRVFPESLKGIQLQDNLWECDCHLTDLHEFITNFKIPHNLQPTCKGPPRLESKQILITQTNDLACLPDVSPTTFFLEIGEGKNISLLCHVSAIPEAQVSWWFQGQLLQNDSIIAPGVRLLYYIEEGREQKKSELFIYNTNAEDNGTFICSAENAAGVAHSNFTIRVVLKQEPNFEVVTLPIEIVVIIMSAAAITLIILVLIILLSIAKCCRDSRMRRKREANKSLSNSTKDILMQDTTEEFSESSKESCNVVDRQQMLFYTAALPTNELLKPMSPITTSNQLRSPSSLRRFQLEQNPDLINDTENGVGRRRDGDGKDDLMSVNAYPEDGLENFELQQTNVSHGIMKTPNSSRRSNRDLYRLSADVHLTPVGLLQPAETPRNSPFNGSCYRTLPYNRAGKRQSAANPIARFSREAEFLSQSMQPAAYEHFCEDVRYTADGYPVRVSDIACAGVKGSTSSCGTDPIPQCHQVHQVQNSQGHSREGSPIQVLQVQSPQLQVQPLQGLHLADHQLQGHQLQGHPVSGQQIQGHQLHGHQLQGHHLQGHLIQGHQLQGQLIQAQQLPGHPTPGLSTQGHQHPGHQLPIHHLQGSLPDQHCQGIQWPPCLPGNLSRGSSIEDSIPLKVKKSVGAQTQTDCEETKVVTTSVQTKPINKSLCNIAKVNETLTESPDEGYEGESVETSSNNC